jgi:dethiobiotin synthetase
MNIFITGTDTNVGKTLISSWIALHARFAYFKPIQTGLNQGADSQQVKELSNAKIYPEIYAYQDPVSPHLAARIKNDTIDIEKILLPKKDNLIIEGAGGIMVPLNDSEFIIDLIEQLGAKVILVSRNYLGSINHSLLTAAICKQRNIDVIGWIFNDQYLDYEEDIVRWSCYPKIASIPLAEKLDKAFVLQQANLVRKELLKYL